MKIIFSDFDGTLTNNGFLSAVFFDILNLIQANQSKLVIVSGRSLSWGHFFLTHFNIKAVIMEGGGVILTRGEDRTIKEEALISSKTIQDLEALTQKLLKEIPQTILSADSFGRKTDRAIEFMQMENKDVVAVERFLKSNGANFSRSNVHINFWLDDISKSSGVSHFLKEFEPNVKPEETIFYGDAMNDESMFRDFENSVGVSNIDEIIDQLKFKPKTILTGKENIGAYGVLYHLKELFR